MRRNRERGPDAVSAMSPCDGGGLSHAVPHGATRGRDRPIYGGTAIAAVCVYGDSAKAVLRVSASAYPDPGSWSPAVCARSSASWPSSIAPIWPLPALFTSASSGRSADSFRRGCTARRSALRGRCRSAFEQTDSCRTARRRATDARATRDQAGPAASASLSNEASATRARLSEPASFSIACKSSVSRCSRTCCTKAS